MQKFWVMKTEPSEYSISDLERDKKTVWTGIRNYQVRNMLRDQMSNGEQVLIYHSSIKIPGVVGEAIVSKEAFPDPLQFDTTSEYFDSKSTKENPRWLSAELLFVKKFEQIIPLEEIRTKKVFEKSPLTQKGNRLSVILLTASQFKSIK